MSPLRWPSGRIAPQTGRIELGRCVVMSAARRPAAPTAPALAAWARQPRAALLGGDAGLFAGPGGPGTNALRSLLIHACSSCLCFCLFFCNEADLKLS